METQLEFLKEQTYFSFPRWTWPLPGSYNGSSGAERVRGWQIQVFLTRNGWLPLPRVCSVTGSTASPTYHGEDYLIPWDPIPVSRGVHARIHQRFRNPERWRRFLEEAALPGCWAFAVTCCPVPAVPRTADDYRARIVGRIPIPAFVQVPWAQLFRDDDYAASLADMTMEEVARFVASNTWTFARTLSHIPHEYVVKSRCSDAVAFERLVLWIRKVGVKRPFGRAHYIYLDFEGWSYWSMGNTLSATTVLNRARISQE